MKIAWCIGSGGSDPLWSPKLALVTPGGFPPSVIQASKILLHQLLGQTPAVDEDIGQNPEIFIPPKVLQFYALGGSQLFHGEFLGPTGPDDFSTALAANLRRINTLDPHTDTFTHNGWPTMDVHGERIGIINGRHFVHDRMPILLGSCHADTWQVKGNR